MLKSVALFLSITFVNCLNLHAQDIAAGEWKGSINVMNQQLNVELTLVNENNEWSGSLNIPQQNAFGLQLTTTEVYPDSVFLAFQAGMTQAYFEGTFSTDSLIEGTFKQGMNAFPFSIRKQAVEKGSGPDLPETEIVISSGELAIGGTLLNDPGTSDKPLIILISGSGAQPRDVNVFGFEVFRTLAEDLFKAGYPTFRYDDRQTGKSTGSFADATLNDLSSDVEIIMNHFKDREEQDFDTFILLGHSQGGMVAGKVAASSDDVAGVILMASPGLSLKDILAFQVKQAYEPTLKQYPEIVTEEMIDEEIRLREEIMTALRDNGSAEAAIESYNTFYTELLEKIYEASGQTNADIESAVQRQATGLKAAFGSPQMLSMLFYDPASDLTGLSVPVVALFGEKDTQVPPSLNREETESALEIAGVNYMIKVIPDANHLFQTAQTGQVNEYGSLDKAFDPDFIQKLKDWLETNF